MKCKSKRKSKFYFSVPSGELAIPKKHFYHEVTYNDRVFTRFIEPTEICCETFRHQPGLKSTLQTFCTGLQQYLMRHFLGGGKGGEVG